MINPVIIYLMLSGVMAWFGRNRAIGPWGFLMLSLIASPIISAIVLLATEPSES